MRLKRPESLPPITCSKETAFKKQAGPKRKRVIFLSILFLVLVSLNNSACLQAYHRDSNEADHNLVEVLITTVVDGDTARAILPDGSEERVRFIGVDAPEINHPTKGLEYYGPEAEAFARSTLENRRVWLEFDQNDRDQYGRLLAYLWLQVPGEITDREIRSHMFNARLLLEGYAVQVTFQPNVKYKELFSIYESEAREQQVGLWEEHADEKVNQDQRR